MLWPRSLLAFTLGVAVWAYHLPPWAILILCTLVIRPSRSGWRDAGALFGGVVLGWWRFVLVSAPIAMPLPSFLVHVVALSRSFVTSTLGRILPEPEASFAGGLLIGKVALAPHATASLIAAMRRTGTLHLLAVSGFNVTIVVSAIELALAQICGPKPRALISFIALLIFIFLTGAESSVLRAGVMVFLTSAARLLGRPAHAFRVLILAALGMAAVTPSVVDDLGFQLSVAATAGLVLWSGPMSHALRRLPDVAGARTALTTTLAAQVLTTPLILVRFGTVALVSPLANLVVLPVIPWAMAASAVGAALGWIPVVGEVIGWFLWLPLTGVVRTLEAMADWPMSSLRLAPSWWWMFLLPIIPLTIMFKRHDN